MKHEKPKIGVYICHCGMNISPKVDVEDVARFAAGLDHVTIARDYKFMCSNPGQDFISSDIRQKGVNRVVVASCSPRMHEPTFRKACEKAGINPHYFQMANIREQISWVTRDSKDATEKAKDQVAAAVARVAHHAPLVSREVPVKKSVLVIGGGIAGIQAALTSAESGYDVHLVEREPSIGGNMAKFDKTFPSLDCAACIMTPKMVEAGQHEKIKIHSYAEIASIEGFVGNFKVNIKHKPRYVEPDKCTGCGLCAEKCPVSLANEFDQGLTRRKAVYRSFPQAVPIAFCIDKKDRAPCTGACPAGINVQGYIQLIAKGRYEEALKLIRTKLPLPGVLGRVCPHPCEATCRRQELDEPVAICSLKRFVSDQIHPSLIPFEIGENRPEKIAVIGSGPAGLTVAHDLRRLGYQVTIFEAHSKLGGMLRLGIPDYRLPSDILDAEIDAVLKMGISVRTGVRFGNDLTLSDLRNEGFSAVFLGIGAHVSLKMNVPGEDTVNGVIDAITFLREVSLGSQLKISNRVVVIGGGNVAIDSARVAKRSGAGDVLILYRRTEQEMPAYPEEILGAKEEGIRFLYLAAPIRIMENNGKVTGIECYRTELGSADKSGRRRPVKINGSEFIIDCDTIIPAIGQRLDLTVADVMPELELTQHHTIQINPKSMQTSIPYVFSAGDAVSGPATVIEAVAMGHTASRGIHHYLQGITFDDAEMNTPESISSDGNWLEIPPDKKPEARAVSEYADPSIRLRSFGEVNVGFSEKQAMEEANRCLNCGACCECMECVKACEVQAIRHDMKETIETVDVGAVIVSTGFKIFDPTPLLQYGYGIYPEVYTSLEFERLNNATGPTAGSILMRNGLPPKQVAIIHCVGSRDKKHRQYCSRVCCMYSMKFAHLIREKTGAEVWEFYIDIRSPGKLYEEFYNRVQEEGVHLIRGRVAEITDMVDHPKDKGRLTVVAENTLTRRVLRVPADMVILSVGLEPADGSDALGRMLGIARDRDGWFNELHVKLAPVKTAVSGIFLAGCCQGPKDIPDTVAQASAAAGEAVSLLSKGTVRTLAEISHIDPDICSGCRTCVSVCPYSAIGFDELQYVAVVNDALCQGCGSCAAACPSSAAAIGHFTDQQVMGELEAILE